METLSRLFKALRANLPLDVPGLGRVTPDQFGVLAHLMDSGGCTMGELAAARAIAMNSATALVERLVLAGFVSREHAASDRRVVRVSATPAAAQLVTTLRRRREQYLGRMVAQLEEPELQALQAALPALARLTRLTHGPETRT